MTSRTSNDGKRQPRRKFKRHDGRLNSYEDENGWTHVVRGPAAVRLAQHGQLHEASLGSPRDGGMRKRNVQRGPVVKPHAAVLPAYALGPAPLTSIEDIRSEHERQSQLLTHGQPKILVALQRELQAGLAANPNVKCIERAICVGLGSLSRSRRATGMRQLVAFETALDILAKQGKLRRGPQGDESTAVTVGGAADEGTKVAEKEDIKDIVQQSVWADFNPPHLSQGDRSKLLERLCDSCNSTSHSARHGAIKQALLDCMDNRHLTLEADNLDEFCKAVEEKYYASNAARPTTRKNAYGIGVFFQEIEFDTLEKDYLTSSGYNVVEMTDEAKGRVFNPGSEITLGPIEAFMTDSTFFFAPHLEIDVIRQAAGVAPPLLYFGTNLKSWHARQHGLPCVHEKAPNGSHENKDNGTNWEVMSEKWIIDSDWRAIKECQGVSSEKEIWASDFAFAFRSPNEGTGDHGKIENEQVSDAAEAMTGSNCG